MTKLQKKKLKKKIKKEQNKNADEDRSVGSFEEDDPEFMEKRTKAAMEQLVTISENEEELKHQRPRSHSLPNLAVHCSDEPFSDEMEENPSYVFRLERNFGYEV